MTSKLFFAFTLMALCVAVQAIGLSGAFRYWVRRGHVQGDRHFWTAIRLLVFAAGWIIFLHLVQIGIWALFYSFVRGMPDIPSAFYFSAVTYTTTGYGDLVLPPEWRVVGGIEALTGILMCGLSTGFFFAMLNRLFGVRPE